MAFKTQIEFSNRQVKQNERDTAILSGSTSFGLTFSALTTGPNLNTTGITYTQTNIVSTFSGNSLTTNFTWFDNSMQLAAPTLSAITPSNSGITQYTGAIFEPSVTTTIDGNQVALAYSGVSFDIVANTLFDLGGGAYSGIVLTNQYIELSAATLDYTGRTIWVDVSGITRSQKLILTNLGSGPGIIDVGIDANGFLVDQASDLRLKENIQPINNALEKVMGLKGVTYNWRNRDSGGDAIKYGFIAQDVNKIVPELTYVGNQNYMGVHYKDFPALIVEAIKELVNGGKINEILTAQTIVAEDNLIELNFNGDKKTAIGGGIQVFLGNNQVPHKFLINSENQWSTNIPIKPVSLIIPNYTPTSSNDDYGVHGEITMDNDYLYIKTNIWKRIKLEEF